MRFTISAIGKSNIMNQVLDREIKATRPAFDTLMDINYTDILPPNGHVKEVKFQFGIKSESNFQTMPLDSAVEGPGPQFRFSNELGADEFYLKTSTVETVSDVKPVLALPGDTPEILAALDCFSFKVSFNVHIFRKSGEAGFIEPPSVELVCNREASGDKYHELVKSRFDGMNVSVTAVNVEISCGWIKKIETLEARKAKAA